MSPYERPELATLLRRGRRSVLAPTPAGRNADSSVSEKIQPLEPLVPGFGPLEPEDIPEQRRIMLAGYGGYVAPWRRPDDPGTGGLQ